MRGFLLLSLAALLGTGFAGCVGGEGASTEIETNSSEQAAPAEFSDETGAVEGLVSDEEGQPIADAQVAILGGGEISTTTAADGRFSLSNIPPGKQVIAAQKLGYESVSRSIEVKLGEVSTMTLVLLAIAVVESYHNSFTLKGYFDCTWYISGTSGPCGFTQVNGTTGNPLEPLWVNSKRKWNYMADPHAMTITNEITWQKGTAATADQLRVIMSHGPINGKERDGVHNFCVTGGVNPVRMRWEREDAEDDGACKTGTDNPTPGPKTISWDKGLLLQSFVSVNPASIGGAVGQPVALAYQQSFELHISRFYGEKAPEGWSAIPDT
jgi:hypothetical protein